MWLHLKKGSYTSKQKWGVPHRKTKKKQHLYKNKQVTGSLRHAICEMLRHKI